MISPNSSTIFSELVTTHDVDSLMQGFARLQELLFTTRGTHLEKVDQAFSEGEKQAMQQLMEQEQLLEVEPVILKRRLKQLEIEIQALPILTIAVAIELPYKTLKRVSGWLEESLNRKIILEVNQEPGLLAGVAIYHNGNYRDYSLKHKLEDMADRGYLGISRLFGEGS